MPELAARIESLHELELKSEIDGCIASSKPARDALQELKVAATASLNKVKNVYASAKTAKEQQAKEVAAEAQHKKKSRQSVGPGCPLFHAVPTMQSENSREVAHIDLSALASSSSIDDNTVPWVIKVDDSARREYKSKTQL